MESTTIRSKMEFSEQQMNFLEDPLGFSADLFADDLDTEGGILGLDLGGGLKHHQFAPQESLEDLLQADSHEDTLGEEWMETVDLQTLLNAGSGSGTTTEAAPQPIKIEKAETRQEGMNKAAFELLKALLTNQQPVKSELSVSVLPAPEPVLTSASASPVAEVPNIDFSDHINLLLERVESSPVIHSFEDLIQPEFSFENGDIAEIQASDASETNTFSTEESVTIFDSSFPESNAESALSTSDVESFLSSGPTSPSAVFQEMSTIDSSCLSETSRSSTAKSIQVSSEDFTKLKSKSKKAKAKATPYDYDQDDVSNKRLRKKMQNKNAATRYREKKRQEKETLQEQEVRLSDKNKELREKVESLQREIKYMKELMNEINKAKHSKI